MKIQAITVKPNQVPQIVEIENDLFTYQQIVDGYIEPVCIGRELVALVNEEGGYLGMSANFNIGYTTLVGPVVIVRDTGKEEYQSLKPSQIEEVWEIIKEGRTY